MPDQVPPRTLPGDWASGEIRHVVKAAAAKAGIAKLSPHDCRRTCARLCHAAGAELEQIQFLLGHVSVETTERYLGCKQRRRGAVNDHIGLEPWRRLPRIVSPHATYRPFGITAQT